MSATANLTHLRSLCDDTGLIEHGWLGLPRRQSGYTTDDNGRMLAVLGRPVFGDDDASIPLITLGVSFLQHASLPGGNGFHNRMTYDRRWADARGSDDSHGRALWGLGVVAARTDRADLRETSHRLFFDNLALRTQHPRAAVYALLGAVEMADLDGSAELHRHVRNWVGLLPAALNRGAWMWPVARLTYDNARIPEAMIKAGVVLADEGLVGRGLDLLDWLVESEMSTSSDHFSFTPETGRGRDDLRPGFDQQPLEAWAMADATLAAATVAGPRWLAHTDRAVEWFAGRNDLGEIMFDQVTGAGFDGLTARGVNRNRGAESTLSALACMARLQAGSRPR